MDEVVEEACQKLKKEDVGYITTYYATNSVNIAVETWKRKSVSIVSPKSGRILRQKKTSESKDAKSEKSRVTRDSGFFSRIFDDLRISSTKVADFTYQQPRVRQNSSYKPFWATQTKDLTEPPEKTEELEAPIAKAEITEQNNAVANKKIVFVKESIGSPRVRLTDKATKETLQKRLSSIENHQVYKLKMPPLYNGSSMRMPTGEQLFWVRLII